MKKYNLKNVLIGVGVVAVVLLILSSLLLTSKKGNKNYYQIICGEGQYQRSYIATKKKGNKYLIMNEYRELPGCVENYKIVK